MVQILLSANQSYGGFSTAQNRKRPVEHQVHNVALWKQWK